MRSDKLITALTLAALLLASLLAGWQQAAASPPDPVAVARAAPEFEAHQHRLRSTEPIHVRTQAVADPEDPLGGAHEFHFVAFALHPEAPIETPDLADMGIDTDELLVFVVADDSSLADVMRIIPRRFEVDLPDGASGDPNYLPLEDGRLYSEQISLRNADAVPPQTLEHGSASGAAATFALLYRNAYNERASAYAREYPGSEYRPYQMLGDCTCSEPTKSLYKMFRCAQRVEVEPKTYETCADLCSVACEKMVVNMAARLACVAACQYIVCRDPGGVWCIAAWCSACAL